MWTCNKCEKTFKNKNQWHSCGNYTEELFLSGCTGNEKDLYMSFRKILLGLGSVRISPAKTRIGFIDQMTFAAVNNISNGKIKAHIILKSRKDSIKFFKVEKLSKFCYIHNFEFYDTSFFDTEMLTYLKEAYLFNKSE